MTKLHASVEELLELPVALAEVRADALDEALLEELAEADAATGALLDAHSTLFDVPEALGDSGTLVHADSTIVKATKPPKNAPRDVTMGSTLMARRRRRSAFAATSSAHS